MSTTRAINATIRRALYVGLSAFACLATAGTPASQKDDDAHRAAVAQARAGTFSESLQTLGRLALQRPGRPQYLHDYVLVLDWAGRHEDVLRVANRLAPRSPAYVHEAIGRSARALGNHTLAAMHFRYAMAMAPDALSPVVGLARVHRESGYPHAARQALLGIEPIHGNTTDWLIARAHVAEGEAKYADALRFFQRAGQSAPDNTEAIAGQARIASRVGAPQAALELVNRHPRGVDQKLISSLAGDQVALAIRAGSASADAAPHAARFAMLDRAIAQSDGAEKQFMENPTGIDATQRRILVDRLQALSLRYRMRDATALYERLDRADHTIPAYGKRAAGLAYQYLEEPRKALALFEAADREDPDNFDGRMSTFYALVENDRHAESIAFIDRIAAAVPRRIGAWSDATTRDNPDYVSAQVARINARIFADDLDGAEGMIRTLRKEAPANHEVRIANAALDKARGRPRLADAELQSVLQHEEDHAGAYAERVAALIEMHAFGAAERAVAEVRQRRPEDKRAHRAERQILAYNSPELIVEAARGTSRGNAPSGARDLSIDSYFYSSPLSSAWRVFGHFHLADAKFAADEVEWRRVGVGVEHRVRDWRLAGEVNGNTNGSMRIGGTVTARWWADDAWSVGGLLEAQSNAVPLQARRAGVSGNRGALDVQYRVHESRSFDVMFGVVDLSDTNRRQSMAGGWNERWYSGPRLKIGTTVGVYRSSNTLTGAAYFNPGHDTSLSVAPNFEWLTWRNYTRSFTQRVTMLGGTYSQRAFGTGPMWGGEYEHILKWNERVELRYGVSRTVHPYDGQQSGRNAAHLGLNWRFSAL